MANLIFNAFAFKEDFQSSMQLTGNMDEEKLTIYMENIFVSLKSAALHNPQDDVMLVVNGNVPERFREQFERENIKIKEIPFDRFVMPKSFVWALAFFKLCALSYVVETENYENYLLLDTDTLTVEAYDEMWQECKTGVILYPLGHSYHHHDRERIRTDYERLYEEPLNLVHYGGEYVCGSRRALGRFTDECAAVYARMKEKEFQIDDHTGDETILSIAAARLQAEESAEGVRRGGIGEETRVEIIAAVPYVYRYWTNAFYLVSTNTIYNPVCIWHLPDEKEHAMRYFYRYYKKNGRFPEKKRCMRIAGLKLAKRPFNRYTLLYKTEGKLRKLRKRL